jgi:hypothetical protein
MNLPILRAMNAFNRPIMPQLRMPRGFASGFWRPAAAAAFTLVLGGQSFGGMTATDDTVGKSSSSPAAPRCTASAASRAITAMADPTLDTAGTLLVLSGLGIPTIPPAA